MKGDRRTEENKNAYQINVLFCAGLVLGLSDADINNHPEDKMINFFLMWEGRGRGIVPRGRDI